MAVLAYCYCDPLLDREPPPPEFWGEPVDRAYCDWGARTERDRLLAEVRDGDRLLLRRYEELGDSAAAVVAALETLSAAGVSVAAVADDPEAAPPLRRAPDELLALLDAIQRDRQSRQIRRGHARNRLNAVPPPGPPPYGYQRRGERYALDRAAAPAVKGFFEHFLLYGSLRGAVRHLARKYGKRISPATGRRWLTHPAYRGDLAYGTGDILPDIHPAIVGREEAAQVDRLLRRNRDLAPRTASAPRSLSGLTACATCGCPMTVTRSVPRSPPRGGQREYLYLRPAACARRPLGERPCRAAPYAAVLAETIDWICATLPEAARAAAPPNPDVRRRETAEAIAAKREILAQLPDLEARGILDAETARLRAYRLRAEIGKLEEARSQLPPADLSAIARAVSIPQFWMDLSEAERRFYFREFIRRIDLAYDGDRWQVADIEFAF